MAETETLPWLRDRNRNRSRNCASGSFGAETETETEFGRPLLSAYNDSRKNREVLVMPSSRQGVKVTEMRNKTVIVHQLAAETTIIVNDRKRLGVRSIMPNDLSLVRLTAYLENC